MQAGSRRTVYFAEIPGDSDILQMQANFQKTLAHVLADVFGSTTPQFTGLNVSAGTGFSINIGTGNVYQQIQAEASAWGSTAHGLPIDTEVITKVGSVPTALTNQFSGSFAAPGSGTNYYTLEAKLLDADINSLGLTFNPQPGVYSSQTLTADRVTQVQFQVKGPSVSAPPAADTGWFAIATFAVPSTATQMLGGYITMASAFPGFAGILAGGSFVQLSPGSAQSGFLNLSGNGTFGGAVVAGSLSVTGTAVTSGLFTASGGINCNGVLNANAQAVVGTTGASGTPLTVQGVAGGGQTAALISALLQSAGTVLFQVDNVGGVLFGGNGTTNGRIYCSSGFTRFVPGVNKPFQLRNAADSQANIACDNSGNVTILNSLVVGSPSAVLTCDSSGNLTGNGRVSLVGSCVDATGSLAQNFTSPGTGSITLPSGGTWSLFIVWHGVESAPSGSGDLTISVASGTVSGFTQASSGPGPGTGTAGFTRAAIGSAAGGQTITFNFAYTVAGVFLSVFSIRAVRTS